MSKGAKDNIVERHMVDRLSPKGYEGHQDTHQKDLFEAKNKLCYGGDPKNPKGFCEYFFDCKKSNFGSLDQCCFEERVSEKQKDAMIKLCHGGDPVNPRVACEYFEVCKKSNFRTLTDCCEEEGIKL